MGRPEIARSGTEGGRAVEVDALGARANIGALGGGDADAWIIAARRHQAGGAGRLARVEDRAAPARIPARNTADTPHGSGVRDVRRGTTVDAGRARAAARCGGAAGGEHG